jgi:hypothetical protein
MDAKEYDPRPAQRRKRIIISAILAVGIPLATWYFFFLHWPEEHVVDKFFQALEQKDFDTAYGLNRGDPAWKQHPEKYSSYTINQFTLDWGPSGDYGPITSHHVDCSLEPASKDFASPSGIIVVVTINGRAEPKSMWVEKKDKAVGDSPYTVQCRGKQ